MLVDILLGLGRAQSAQLGTALIAWHQHTGEAQALRQRLKFYVHMRSDQICTAVFHAWADAVAAKRYGMEALVRFPSNALTLLLEHVRLLVLDT